MDPLQQRSTRTGIFPLSPLHGRLSWQGSSLMQPVIDRGSSRHSRNVRSMSILALLAVCNYDIAISFEGNVLRRQGCQRCKTQTDSFGH